MWQIAPSLLLAATLLACSKPARRADPVARDAGVAPDAAPVIAAPPIEDVAPAVVVPPGIVDVADIDPSIRVEMMYAGDANFLGRPAAGYRDDVCYLTTDAALALRDAQARLQRRAPGHGLLVRDCYRPQRAVDDFVAWAADPADVATKAAFYPDLTKPELIRQNYIAPRSGHTRGSSVDLTIIAAGGPLDMGSAIDFFGERSHTAFAGISAEQRAARDLLLEVMTPAFKNYPKEWWHFVLRDEPPARAPLGFDVVSADRTGSLDGIHRTHGLPRPAAAVGRAHGDHLAGYDATYGAIARQVTEDVGRIVTDLAIDWEDDIAQTYVPAAARTEGGRVLRQTGDVARVFKPAWLTSRDGQLVLAGVVSRPDRRDFTRHGCGEVRLIYRLGYGFPDGGEVYASRLPFTLNLVFEVPDDGAGCRAAVRWSPPDLSALRFKQLELNAQVVRFPSGLEHAEARGFAGQAIYLMRVFRLDGGRLRPAPLENTPDVQAIAQDPAKRQALEAFISANQAAIDQGVFTLPEHLLADVALSYSTLGSARRANRPYDALFTPEQAARLARPAWAVIRRRRPPGFTSWVPSATSSPWPPAPPPTPSGPTPRRPPVASPP